MTDAMEHFIIGVDAFKSGEIDKAIKELEAATQEDKKSYKAFAYLGAAYAAKERYNAAIGAFKTAEQLNPGIPSIHYNIAQAYEAAGVPNEAQFEYERALQIDPHYTKAAEALAELKKKLEQKQT